MYVCVYSIMTTFFMMATNRAAPSLRMAAVSFLHRTHKALDAGRNNFLSRFSGFKTEFPP